MIDKEKLKRRFSRNARQYDRYAAVQKIMAQALIADIQKDGAVYTEILEIGCGTGYLTRLLAEAYPDARITAVDLAEGMIAHAASKTANENIAFMCADAEEMALDQSYDLIVSNATFQWFNHLEETLGKLTRHLSEGGKLCFSTFGHETFTELHQAFDTAKKQLGIQSEVAPGQAFITSEALKAMCEPSGQFVVTARESLEKEYFDTCLDFLASVKKIGANKSQVDSAPVPGLIEEVMRVYDGAFRDEAQSQVYATYHCLYFNLTKPLSLRV